MCLTVCAYLVQFYVTNLILLDAQNLMGEKRKFFPPPDY
jgi:hypothetical protein